jgi:hypothetical protein
MYGLPGALKTHLKDHDLKVKKAEKTGNPSNKKIVDARCRMFSTCWRHIPN